MTGRPLRAVVCGYGEIATVGLECLHEAGWEIPLFVTHADSPQETIWWRSPSQWARARGIEVTAPDDVNAPREVERIAAVDPDFLFSLFFRALVGPALLALPRRGALNLHGSLLPRYRGRAPVNWVLVNGETETGVTLHYMDEKPDHGEIVLQRRIPIAFEDTGLTLFRKVAEEGGAILRQALPLLAAGSAPRVPQAHDQAGYFGRRRPEDGRIDWGWPARRVYNLVRAVTRPYPGAFTLLGGRKILIWWGLPAERRPERAGAAPGTVLGPREGGVEVAAGSGSLLVLRAQIEGEEERKGPALTAILPAGLRLPT